VLPDEAPAICPGTLGRKLSWCEEGMARVFAVMAEICWHIRVSRSNFDRSRVTITGYIALGQQWSGRGTLITNLSRKQELFAKTVTNK